MRATSIRTGLAVASLLAASEAFAEGAAPCVIEGVTSPAPNTELFLEAAGGAPHAKFTGVLLRVKLVEPTFAPGSRLKVETGDGTKPYLRVNGHATPSAFRFFAKEAVSLVGGQVWLTKGVEIQPKAAASGEVEFEHAVLGTRAADGAPTKLRGKLPCAAVGLAPIALEATEPPKGARWYHMKTGGLKLFDRAQGAQVLELKMDDDARKVFWSTEVRAGWVHVVSPGDVTLDGWVRMNELEPQIHGELIDMNALAPKPLASPTLALAEPPKVLTAVIALPIASKPAAGAAPLGLVEPGATFHAMDVSTEWTSVVPTDLALMPLDGNGFWVKTSTLPR
ncbi:MAG: hypothetical protein FJ095_03620 [Deltaproteobacteria bacterium]|nr:hypothetical protein [Deltaproteobacteria bacterium]